jgi:transposase-like protein
LAERGIIVSYETIRQWCSKFGSDYARRLQKIQGRLGDTWYLDELFVRIIERLIGTIRREYLDRMLFWTAADLEAKLIDFRHYYNRRRTHAGLDGRLPEPDGSGAPLDF